MAKLAFTLHAFQQITDYIKGSFARSSIQLTGTKKVLNLDEVTRFAGVCFH